MKSKLAGNLIISLSVIVFIFTLSVMGDIDDSANAQTTASPSESEDFQKSAGDDIFVDEDGILHVGSPDETGTEGSELSDDLPADVADEDIFVDEEGNVYIDGIIIEDGDVVDDGIVVSIEDVMDEDSQTDTFPEDEPFTLNIQFADPNTCVAFLPTEEGLAIQKRVLDIQRSESQDFEETEEDVRALLPDGRIELTIHIAPGKTEQAELPLKFGLEIREGMYADLLVWDSDLQAFADVLPVQNIRTDVEKSVALSLLLPTRLVERLKGTIGTLKTFKIVSWVDGERDKVAEVANVSLVELSEAFESEETRKASRGRVTHEPEPYVKCFSNKYFGAKFEGRAKSDFNEEGSETHVEASVDVWVLGKCFRFIEADGKVYNKLEIEKEKTAELNIDFLKKSLWSYVEKGSFRYVNNKKYKKEVGASMRVMIWIIPVKLEAGAYGSLGMDFDIHVTRYTHLYAKIHPFVDAGAYASASISFSIPKIVSAEAGIRGDLSIIKDDFWGRAECDMTLKGGGRYLEGNLDLRVWNELHGPSGKLSVYVKYKTIWICKKKVCIWFCFKIPYPCEKRGEKDWKIVDWHSFHRSDTLLNKSATATVKLF